jgi:hypothetical protein
MGAYQEPDRLPPTRSTVLFEGKLKFSQKEGGIWSISVIIWLKLGFSEVAASCSISAAGSGCSEDFFSSRIRNNSASCSDILKPRSLRNCCCFQRREWWAKVAIIFNWTLARQAWSCSSLGYNNSSLLSALTISLATLSSACFKISHSFAVWNSFLHKWPWWVQVAHLV